MRRTASLLIIGMLIVTACGDSGSTETTSAPGSTAEEPESTDPETTSAPETPGEIDPCGFLADSEMSQVLGFDVVSSPTDLANCEYVSPETGEAIALNVENVAGQGCEGVFNVAGFGTGVESVDGVGTYARFTDSLPPQLAVCFDDQLTLIASDLTNSDDNQATLVAVAQAFEANLP